MTVYWMVPYDMNEVIAVGSSLVRQTGDFPWWNATLFYVHPEIPYALLVPEAKGLN